MKKSLLLIFVFLLTASFSYSQNFVFHKIGPSIVYGDTSSLNTTIVKGILTNLSSSPQTFKLVRVYKDIPSGWSQSVCTYMNCYGDGDTIPPHGAGNYTLGAGQSDTVLSFDFYGNTIGTAKVVWRAYVDGTPSVFIQDTIRVHLGPVGITPISSIVKDFELKQNYPNPFNPTTSIIFSLKENSDVSLIVYDMQGREVTRLLNNSKLSQGSYKYNFNAGDYNLSSGAYFYKLETKDYVSTKKMLLIK